jgi:hypothetical protein
MEVICASAQTKIWRMNQVWWAGGKRTECEVYQRQTIERMTGNKCVKTNMRIHREKKTLLEVRCPFTYDDGFEYTENFDGKQTKGDHTLFYNLKMVCNKGGSQTRTLQLVYDFIKNQIDFLISSGNKNIFFVNILDGDESYRNRNKFIYLFKKIPDNMRSNLYCGDLKNYMEWYNQIE